MMNSPLTSEQLSDPVDCDDTYDKEIYANYVTLLSQNLSFLVYKANSAQNEALIFKSLGRHIGWADLCKHALVRKTLISHNI